MLDTSNDLSPAAEAARKRYLAAAHKVQSAYHSRLNLPQFANFANDSSEKHLRTGVDMAQRDSGSLAYLLIKKGLVTELEVWEALADGMEVEAAVHAAELSEVLGGPVTLK